MRRKVVHCLIAPLVALLFGTGPASRTLPVQPAPLAFRGTPAEKLAKFLSGAPGVLVLAHRGIHPPQPANSLLAFEAARAAHVDGISMAVVASADGVPMVFEGERLEELTEAAGFVVEHSAAELELVALRGPRDLPTQHLSRLEEVLSRFGGDLILWIDVEGNQPGTRDLELQVAELIHRRGLERNVLLASASWEALGQVAATYPQVALAYRAQDEVDARAQGGMGANRIILDLPAEALTKDLARWASYQFRGVAAWGADSDQELLAAFGQGTRLVQTARPWAARALLGERRVAEEQSGPSEGEVLSQRR